MATIKDLIEFLSSVRLQRDLFGCDKLVQAQLNELQQKIGQSLCRELNISQKEVLALPADTPLPTQAAKLFHELKKRFG